MLLRTYQKIIDLFAAHHGYMSYADLQKERVTILQIRELENDGTVQKFSRGWYWCRKCGIEKADDYKYIEIAKVNPNAVICLESACYLCGMIREAPQVVKVATERGDRRKMEMDFPVQRYFFQNTGLEGEICTKETEFGSYRYYGFERTVCDCIRLKEKMDEKVYLEVVGIYRQKQEQKKRVEEYAKALRALKNVQEIG